MMNLGRNSIKFVTNGFLRFRVTIVDGLVELSVEDSGPGIPVDKQDALFERFQTSLDVLSQGTGLGLSLCLNLVVLLNGRIFLDKNYDSGVPGSPGARFVVQLNQPSLPVESLLPSSEFLADDTSGESASSSISKASIVPENLSVLFVDDDNVLRKLFRRAVKKVAPSWTISEAASGEAALQLVEEMKYDVIFMDQYMASTQKQMLGTETVRELRVRGVDSIICGLSANNMEESFLNAGADAFLLKPFPCEREAMERELARISQSRSPV
jgi:CheY-like chemotaxis protein